ncbi:MAG: elongation factor P maturation arginine rhamnosyltransferase EarP [Betaproteobacteria bacterium]|nr:elongation factor P maturation arginine rhamnosyltransferase EarP [Betaproteobacteria bacterium]
MKVQHRWDLFCHVVDNLGDIGVTWRLARQLAAEHQQQVRLFLDDFKAFAHIAPQVQLRAAEQTLAGVQIVPWARQAQATPGDVVIEMFGCHLSDAFIAQIGKASPQPVWLNLEHLSAEKWVDLHHLKPSPQSGGLMKYFYYPGFTDKSGGLLRESNLISQRDNWQMQPSAKRIALRALGLPPPPDHALTVLLFSYARQRLDGWLHTMAASERPVALWVCPGPVMTAINTWLDMTLQTGQITSRGSLSIYALPYIPQQRFDELLWAADVCIVRGEDSFVRAQWAAKPFVWHIYPQEDSAHDRKLDAFLDLYLNEADSELRDTVVHFWTAWNRGLDLAPAWMEFVSSLPALQRHALKWSRSLQTQADQASQLVDEVQQLASNRPSLAPAR